MAADAPTDAAGLVDAPADVAVDAPADVDTDAHSNPAGVLDAPADAVAVVEASEQMAR